EDLRQSILTVFNWSDKERKRSIALSTAGLPGKRKYSITDVLDMKNHASSTAGAVTFFQPPHSVRVLKILDSTIPATPPVVTADHPSAGETGNTLAFAARERSDSPMLLYRWDFG